MRQARPVTDMSPLELDPTPDSRPHSELREAASIPTCPLLLLIAPLFDLLDGAIHPRMSGDR